MTIAFEPIRRRDLPLTSAVSAKVAIVRGTFARLWPPAIVAVGLVVTIGWIGTLLWLSARMILSLI